MKEQSLSKAVRTRIAANASCTLRLSPPPTIARPCMLAFARDRRFRELSEEDRDRLRVASEAEAAAKAQAKEEAAKKAKKGNKKGVAKGKKVTKGAAAAPPPAEEDPTEVEVEPPSILEVYDSVKREVEQHRAMRKEEIERLRAEERLVPRDPAGEAVMEEVSCSIAGIRLRGGKEANARRLLIAFCRISVRDA